LSQVAEVIDNKTVIGLTPKPV